MSSLSLNKHQLQRSISLLVCQCYVFVSVLSGQQSLFRLLEWTERVWLGLFI